MKINLEVDCTPAEARAAMGLPDLTPIHDRYVAALLASMNGSATPEMIDGLMRSWAPMGEAGMAMWRRLFETGGKGGA